MVQTPDVVMIELVGGVVTVAQGFIPDENSPATLARDSMALSIRHALNSEFPGRYEWFSMGGNWYGKLIKTDTD